MIDKKVLIIGGTGALGRALIRRYNENNSLMIFSRDEHKHVDLMKQYVDLESYLGDIRDKDSIRNCFDKFRPDVVINTAALKHVPICESNSIESVKTNINLLISMVCVRLLVRSYILIMQKQSQILKSLRSDMVMFWNPLVQSFHISNNY